MPAIPGLEGIQTAIGSAMGSIKSGIGEATAGIDNAISGVTNAGKSPSQLIADAADTGGKPGGALAKLGAFSKYGDKEDPAQGFDQEAHHEQMLNSGPFLEAKQLADHWDNIAAQRTAGLHLGFGHAHSIQPQQTTFSPPIQEQ